MGPTSKQHGPAGALVARLGLFSTMMLVVGGVIGSGIFRKPGVMAAQLGSPELLMIVWLVAGLITLCGALTNAEVAAMIPETGGQYIFFERMYGPFAGFIYGWAVFAVIQTGSIAAIAYVFAEYCAAFFHLSSGGNAAAGWSMHLYGVGDVAPFSDPIVKAIAAALIVILTAINYLGVKFGGLVQNVFTVAKVGAMAALAAAAFLTAEVGSLAHFSMAATESVPKGLMLLSALAAALQGAFWAYDGWNKVTYIAGEVHRPQQTIPRALVAGMIVVTIIYMTMNAAFLYVMPISEMAGSKLVAADVAERCRSGSGRWISLAVMVSTFGTVNATILATARVYFSMANRGVFPRFIGKAHPRFKTPGASLVVQGIWSVLLLFSGTFDALTDALIFVSWVFYAAGAYGVFVLRKKEPAALRPFRVPWYPVVPAVFVAFALAFLGFALHRDVSMYLEARAAGQPATINCVFGTALVLLGAPLYWVFRRSRVGGQVSDASRIS